jgi:hypothetical protein
MEQLIISLVMALVQGIPQIIDSINKSTTLSDKEKKELLFNLNLQLTEAKVKVAAVRFRDVDVGEAGKDLKVR